MKKIDGRKRNKAFCLGNQAKSKKQFERLNNKKVHLSNPNMSLWMHEHSSFTPWYKMNITQNNYDIRLY
jgi:hypothetical protein